MSFATALSRVTGFMRTWAMAYALGATMLASSYWVANNIPNMVFELVAGGIISSLFIPTFMELGDKRDEAAAWRFASNIFNVTVVSLGLIAILGIIFARPFVLTQTFRMSGAQAETAIELATFFFRLFAIQIVIYGAGSIVSALLNAQRKYLWVALGPVFNNITVIVTLFAYVWLSKYNTDLALVLLASGTTLGVFMMYAVQVPSLVKSGIRYTPGIDWHEPGLRKILTLAVPTVIYVVTNMVAVSFRNASAYAVTEKGPAALGYAWMFYQLPYGILAVALATAVFTELADAAGREDRPAFKDTFVRGLRSTLVLMLPMAAMLIALAEPLVSLYRVGAFKGDDVAVVVSVLRFWAAGLVFFATSMYLLRSFYSLKDTKTPMVVNLILTPPVQIGLYVALTTGVAAWPGLGLIGIPIADGVFYACVSATLALLLRKRIGGYDARGVLSTFARVAVASLAGGLAAYAAATSVAGLAVGMPGSLLQILAGGVTGLAVCYGFAVMLGVREVGDVWAMIKRRLTRRKESQ